MLPSPAEVASFCSSAAYNLTADLRNGLAIGGALLQGRSVYQEYPCYYPLPVAIPYALLSLLPLWLAWLVLFLVNLSLLVVLFRHRALLWLFFAPTFYAATSGQNDLWFMFFERRLTQGTGTAIGAALITLKPQLALILLPFHLQRWWRDDRRTLAKFLAFSAILWFAPWWSWTEWFAKVRTSGPNLHCPPSIWAACTGARLLPLPTIVLVALSLYLIYIALKSKREIAIPALQLAAPFGMGYNTSILTGMAPPWMMLPLSWLIGLLILVEGGRGLDAFAFLPIAVLLYQRRAPARSSTADAGAKPSVLTAATTGISPAENAWTP